ncbi:MULTISPECIES: S-methyl-5-thioribose-1-phosphate isomerase [Pseudothermotoga]|jgi:methylthioribose-1-phosphate isomerase (EC 5.3.1.23)|uniref:Methylthioribose-1-phosphate isomerase 1 n=2 Tax=Pseudothermotoga TaxID=1643951 RepID=MTNA1_PSELT|nr:MULTISPECIES: S-methyl-5-thioribose-1-phosphate isomerase [Pseudothermotoga]A8F3A3.1 RecName: Full=Methylthioribose-1-phosphate isomerase 1; Short=M1Pi 1; Short=MTR-1-P isomerase 1; AltName: Full=S-methyl-5-thioribose-1-phosphate isomerase 1 [Pseudothermotoga lettingae TMO]ABV32637.1 putative translation initiation factor, aIF-2BI family [Pseudothermotoga lettingae TMO]KUK20642.1 MAG: Methylthioribose-1-phosphate isomerase 1 [Pseudothermotoga lettingae]MDK2885104.1 methylthioribose-phosphate
MNFKTLTMQWTGNSLILVDQRKLPHVVNYVECKSYAEVARAIKDMVVRGAPAIGATAAFGYVLGAKEAATLKNQNFIDVMKNVYDVLASTRPTAVNLFWALNRMEKCVDLSKAVDEILEDLEKEAIKIAEEDIRINKTIGTHGQTLLKDGCAVLTHCNAGALATVDYGTALGVIRAAVESGKKIKVYVDETRPYLQGARLTAWELLEIGVETILITDNMAGWVMKQGKIDAVIVGADRIAANGDVANKIGTYSVAVLSNQHGIPFYVAAPTSTIDIKIKNGSEIPIEERSHDEVTHVHGVKVAPDGVAVYNPAFDVTEHQLITAIITEKGILRPPYKENIAKLFGG